MKRSQVVFSLSEMANAESEEEIRFDSSFSDERSRGTRQRVNEETDGYDAVSSSPTKREKIPSSPTRDPEELSLSDEESSSTDEEVFAFDEWEIFNSLESPTRSARASLL